MQTFNYSNLQCFETVGGATGRASGTCKNWVLVCCWSFACLTSKGRRHVTWHQKGSATQRAKNKKK